MEDKKREKGLPAYEIVIGIMDYAIEFEKLIDNFDNEADKNFWRLTVAANIMHDVPKDLLEIFFENYDGIRKEVKEIFNEQEEEEV